MLQLKKSILKEGSKFIKNYIKFVFEKSVNLSQDFQLYSSTDLIRICSRTSL